MKRTVPLVLLAAFALSTAPTAAAHKTAYSPDGAIKVVWGWLSEPSVTMDKNGIDLRIQDNATSYAIPDLQSFIHVELHYGDEEVELELTGQFGKPGYYTATVTPTRPGLYSLHVSGTVNGTELDLDIPASHDVEAIEETYFPPSASESSDARIADLQARVANLSAKVDALDAKLRTQATTPSSVVTQTPPAGSSPAPGVGLLALAVGLVAAAFLVRRRRS